MQAHLLRLEEQRTETLLKYCLMGVVSGWVTGGMGAVGIDGSGIDEVVGCDVSASGVGVGKNWSNNRIERQLWEKLGLIVGNMPKGKNLTIKVP
nr:hypothetical protein [Tanacetum cinerariifolium]